VVADGLWTKLSVLRYAPAAVALDKKWTKGVPDRWPPVGSWLRERTGNDFRVLSQLSSRRAIRALATMLHENFAAASSEVGLPKKLGAGLVFAETVNNQPLAAILRGIGADAAQAHPMARAISPSPAQVDQSIVDACRDLSPVAIVETVSFLSVLQVVHRLMSFYS
jgi:hypothetical protein